MAGFLEIPITGGTGIAAGSNKLVLAKDNIMSITQGDPAGGTPGVITTIRLTDLVEYAVTHTAAAAGFNVQDALIDAWVGAPGNGVSKVGGIPATVSATGQALTFVNFTLYAIS